MFGIDTWYDLWRLGNFGLNVFSVIWLLGGFKRQRKHWNVKTRDLWYSRLMWALAGAVLSVDGIVRGLGLSYSLIFITAASLVTGKGLFRKGAWGYDPEDLHGPRSAELS